MSEQTLTQPTDSIAALHRPEIDAPPHFVSVFHETKEEFLPSIAQNGLMVNTENRNIGEKNSIPERLD